MRGHRTGRAENVLPSQTMTDSHDMQLPASAAPIAQQSNRWEGGKTAGDFGDDDDADKTLPAAAPAPSSAGMTMDYSAAQKDWHREVLCGLFLHSDEQELGRLEGEIAARQKGRGGGNSSRLDIPPRQTAFEAEVGSSCITGGEDSDIKSDGGANEGIRGSDVTATDHAHEFLMQLLNLGHNMDSTVLSTIPEVLRGVSTLAEDSQTLIQDSSNLRREKDSAPTMGGKAVDAGVIATTHGDVTGEGGSQTATSAATAEELSVANQIPGCIPNTGVTVRDGVEKTVTAPLNEHQLILKGDMQQLSSKSAGEKDNPLCIPSSWRRSDYARRTLSELEQHIIESNNLGTARDIRNGRSQSIGINGKNGSHPKHKKQGRKSYDTFTVLYNKCSLTAMANWAMLDHTHCLGAEEGKEQWENYKVEHEKRRSLTSRRHKVIIPPPMFHMCGVCGGFGHYEVECEFFVEDDAEKHDRDASVECGGVEWQGTKKVKTAHDIDDKTRNRAISRLSKEINVQRRQRDLHNKQTARQQEDGNSKKRNAEAAPPVDLALAPIGSQKMGIIHAQKKEGGGGEDEYTGKSSRCKICRSGVEFDGEDMILCDGCDGLFHLKCVDPHLESIPDDDWFCIECISHDSDVSSIAEIEGCGDFVIEQRKRSSAEEEERYSGIILGQCKSSWTTAMTLLPEQDPIVKDPLYLQRHLGRENEHLTKDFFLSELCWVKHFDDDIRRTVWWPGMVTDTETRKSRSRKTTIYTVTLFELGEEKDLRDTEILPFVPYYEDIGHKRLMRCDSSGNNTFRRALILSISALGLKSLGHALNIARRGLQMTAVMNDHHRRLLPPGWKIPVGWESAEIDKVDGIVIMAKEGGGDIPQETADLINDYVDEGDTGFGNTTNKEGNLAETPSASQKMVAEFSLDEIIGCVVSWNNESNDIQYGVVCSVDMASEMALVRSIPILSESSSGKLDGLFHNESNQLVIHASDLGSSIWIPLRHARFVSGKPPKWERKKFRATVNSNMNHQVELYQSQCARDAKFREEHTAELEDCEIPAPIPNEGQSTFVTGPAAPAPLVVVGDLIPQPLMSTQAFCSFTAQQKQGLGSRLSHSVGVRSQERQIVIEGQEVTTKCATEPHVLSQNEEHESHVQRHEAKAQ